MDQVSLLLHCYSTSRLRLLGHAFKYAPIIGREILKVVQRNPSPEYAKRWSFYYGGADTGADVRVGEVKVLKVEDLARAEDLRAPIAVAA